jgi:hypothetical protein
MMEGKKEAVRGRLSSAWRAMILNVVYCWRHGSVCWRTLTEEARESAKSGLLNKEKNILVGKGPKAGIPEKEDVIGWSMMEAEGTWIVCL